MSLITRNLPFLLLPFQFLLVLYIYRAYFFSPNSTKLVATQQAVTVVHGPYLLNLCFGERMGGARRTLQVWCATQRAVASSLKAISACGNYLLPYTRFGTLGGFPGICSAGTPQSQLQRGRSGYSFSLSELYNISLLNDLHPTATLETLAHNYTIQRLVVFDKFQDQCRSLHVHSLCQCDLAHGVGDVKTLRQLGRFNVEEVVCVEFQRAFGRDADTDNLNAGWLASDFFNGLTNEALVVVFEFQNHIGTSAAVSYEMLRRSSEHTLYSRKLERAAMNSLSLREKTYIALHMRFSHYLVRNESSRSHCISSAKEAVSRAKASSHTLKDVVIASDANFRDTSDSNEKITEIWESQSARKEYTSAMQALRLELGAKFIDDDKELDVGTAYVKDWWICFNAAILISCKDTFLESIRELHQHPPIVEVCS